MIRHLFSRLHVCRQLLKHWRKDKEVKGDTRAVVGLPWRLEEAPARLADYSEPNTSFIEHFNLTMR